MIVTRFSPKWRIHIAGTIRFCLSFSISLVATCTLFLVDKLSFYWVRRTIQKWHFIEPRPYRYFTFRNLLPYPVDIRYHGFHLFGISSQWLAVETAFKTIVDPLLNVFFGSRPRSEFWVSSSYSTVIVPKRSCSCLQMTILAVHSI